MSLPPTLIPDPRAYVDYRQYLRDAIFVGWGQFEAGAQRDFAQDARCTEGQVGNMLAGERPLQDEVADGVIAALGLSGDRLAALLLLLRRATPVNQQDADEIEAALLILRAGWVAERDEEAARRGPVVVAPHPAVASYRQDSACTEPDPALALGLEEATAMIGAQGRYWRAYRNGQWTVSTAALVHLFALGDQGAAEMQNTFYQEAAEASDLARRYVWQMQVTLATEPVPTHQPVAPPAVGAQAPTEAKGDEENADDEDLGDDGPEDGEPAPEPPSVFDFLSTHAWLSAWVEDRKRQYPEFTSGRLARRLGIHPSYLHQILKGGRVPDGQLALKISAQCDQSADEHLHLLRLIRMRNTKGIAQTDQVLWDIVEGLVKRQQRPPAPIAGALLGIPALNTLLQLVRVADFREDPAWLGRRAGLSPRRAALGMAYLACAGFVVRDREGQLSCADLTVNLSIPDADQVRRLARLSMVAVQRVASQMWRPHLLWRVDGPLSVAAVQRAMAQAEEVFSRLVASSAQEEGQGKGTLDQVIRIQFQVFPHLPRPTRRRRKPKSIGV